MSTRRAPAKTMVVAEEDRVAAADDPAETEDPEEEAGRAVTGTDQDKHDIIEKIRAECK